MFHDLHHIAGCLPPENIWQRDKSKRTGTGLVPFDNFLDIGIDWDCMVHSAAGCHLCTMKVRIATLSCCPIRHYYHLTIIEKLFLVFPGFKISFLKGLAL